MDNYFFYYNNPVHKNIKRSLCGLLLGLFIFVVWKWYDYTYTIKCSGQVLIGDFFVGYLDIVIALLISSICSFIMYFRLSVNEMKDKDENAKGLLSRISFQYCKFQELENAILTINCTNKTDLGSIIDCCQKNCKNIECKFCYQNNCLVESTLRTVARAQRRTMTSTLFLAGANKPSLTDYINHCLIDVDMLEQILDGKETFYGFLFNYTKGVHSLLLNETINDNDIRDGLFEYEDKIELAKLYKGIYDDVKSTYKEMLMFNRPAPVSESADPTTDNSENNDPSSSTAPTHSPI